MVTTKSSEEHKNVEDEGLDLLGRGEGGIGEGRHLERESVV